MSPNATVWLDVTLTFNKGPSVLKFVIKKNIYVFTHTHQIVMIIIVRFSPTSVFSLSGACAEKRNQVKSTNWWEDVLPPWNCFSLVNQSCFIEFKRKYLVNCRFSCRAILVTRTTLHLSFFCHSPIHTHIHTVHQWAALFLWERSSCEGQFGVQYLAKQHFGMQMGKTGIEPPAFWLEDPRATLCYLFFSVCKMSPDLKSLKSAVKKAPLPWCGQNILGIMTSCDITMSHIYITCCS